MSRVHVLPEDLANQIAAGEVVERPSSAVKELVENALDAGARRIHVEVDEGGSALLRVSDDGAGMDREDARLAVLRHATSKIAGLDDLRAIRSFGFRGEALPSIASVSRFELRTRRAEDAEGTLVRVAGGGTAEVAPCGCSAGTTVEVAELFFNVPARRKFLRSVGAESGRITEVVEDAALGEPRVGFTLKRDGRVVKEWLAAKSREERARSVFRDAVLATCIGERGPLQVEAYLSRPEQARSGSNALSFFVNGRPIRDRTLARSVAVAYGSVLEAGRFPVGVVYLDLPHELVDVNVHPQKSEVRFADGRAVGDALYRVVAEAVTAAFGLPDPGRSRDVKQPLFAEPPAPPGSSWVWPGVTTGPLPVAELAPTDGAPPSSGVPPESSYPLPGALETSSQTIAFGSLRFLAQVRGMFLVCEGDDGIYILDQHAAAERVTFDRIKRGYDAHGVASQKLLFPVVVQVAPGEIAVVEQAAEGIARLGLEIRPIGEDSVAVHAVPQILASAPPERLVRDLLDETSRAGGRAFSGAVDRVLATMACHGSLRAGARVSPEEARALLADLDGIAFAGHCPHGRPVVMRTGWAELEHRVGRR